MVFAKSFIRLLDKVKKCIRCIHFLRKTMWKKLYTFSYTSPLQDLFSFGVYTVYTLYFFIILYYIDFFILLLLLYDFFISENKNYQCLKIGLEWFFLINLFYSNAPQSYFLCIRFCIHYLCIRFCIRFLRFFEENLELEGIKYVYDFVYDITQMIEKYYKKGKNRQKMYTFSYTLQSYTISYTLKILLN